MRSCLAAFAVTAAPLLTAAFGLAPLPAMPAIAQNAEAAAPATLENVVWLSNRQVALWVDSPSMGAPIQVQLLLARDWNTRSDAKFPVLYMLDGLRANEHTSGWLEDASTADFFADKNVTVALPVGGQSSFYSDWLEPDNGKNYQWETFLTEELPPLLESQWRASDVRGMEGLSMGGTAAMFLAARNPDFARYAASHSGFLTTTTLGMPQAIQFAMADAGGFDSNAMWGDPTNPQWEAHDPYLLAEKLRGTSLYISSGSGAAGQFDEATRMSEVSTNPAGTALEVLSRLTSQNFVSKLRELSIPAEVNYRDSGTHSWPYWDFEMRQSWPQAAEALGVAPDAPRCEVGGGINEVVATNGWLGPCLTGEYQVKGGVAQDFHGGRVFFGPDTGAYPVAGMLGGGYQAIGGPDSELGLPIGFEEPLPDGRGRFQQFQHGSLYWTPETGARVVSGAILAEWGRQGFEGGTGGYPVDSEVALRNRGGVVQSFEKGPFYFGPTTGAHLVQGFILGKYAELGFENSWLGLPVAPEQPVKDLGRYSGFEGGAIYWSPLSGAWAVRNGPIMDAWRDAGHENGRLGYPMSDEFAIPGGVQQNFQAGFITVRDNNTEVHNPL